MREWSLCLPPSCLSGSDSVWDAIVERRTHWSMVICPLVVLLTGAICFGQRSPTNPFHGSAEDIDTGRGTFRIYCAPCHGIKAEGGRAPDLTLGIYEAGDSDEDLFKVVADGVGGTEMPGFGGRLSQEGIWRLVAYLRSVARRDHPLFAGDASRGREIYWNRGGCSGCHRIGGQGGRLGPALSRVGRTRSLAYLRDALTQPGKAIAPGYGTVRIVTRDGKTVQGRALNVDNFSAQLMDSNERIHSYLGEEVRSIQRENSSLMPSYASILSQGQIEDLLAYLVSLGRD